MPNGDILGEVDRETEADREREREKRETGLKLAAEDHSSNGLPGRVRPRLERREFDCIDIAPGLQVPCKKVLGPSKPFQNTC